MIDLFFVETPTGFTYHIASQKALHNPYIAAARCCLVEGKKFCFNTTKVLSPVFWRSIGLKVLQMKKAEDTPATNPEARPDPDGEPTPLPTRTPHRYETLGFTPNKFGEHG